MYVSQARGGFNRQITRVDYQSLHPFTVIYHFITVLNPQNQRSISKSARSVTWKCLQSLNVHAMRIFLILYYTAFRNQYDEYTV